MKLRLILSIHCLYPKLSRRVRSYLVISPMLNGPVCPGKLSRTGTNRRQSASEEVIPRVTILV